MNYIELAVQAKREKKFNRALEYYEKAIGAEGLSVGILMGIGKVFYLKGQNDFAIRFFLAGTHLSLYLNNEHYKRGDIGIKQFLQQVPDHLARVFPHPIGAMILFDMNYTRHIAHALLDREEIFQRIPEIRPYAEIYYSHVLGDGSYQQKLQKFNVTSQDQIKFDENHYNNIGYQFIIDSIKWSQIENPDVLNLYFD